LPPVVPPKGGRKKKRGKGGRSLQLKEKKGNGALPASKRCCERGKKRSLERERKGCFGRRVPEMLIMGAEGGGSGEKWGMGRGRKNTRAAFFSSFIEIMKKDAPCLILLSTCGRVKRGKKDGGITRSRKKKGKKKENKRGKSKKKREKKKKEEEEKRESVSYFSFPFLRPKKKRKSGRKEKKEKAKLPHSLLLFHFYGGGGGKREKRELREKKKKKRKTGGLFLLPLTSQGGKRWGEKRGASGKKKKKKRDERRSRSYAARGKGEGEEKKKSPQEERASHLSSKPQKREKRFLSPAFLWSHQGKGRKTKKRDSQKPWTLELLLALCAYSS